MVKSVAYRLGLLALIAVGCQEKQKTLFQSIPPNESGISFINTIEENDTFNILTHEYIYNGGGVGVADFNNDGLQDIFFAGNLVSNRLYLNLGSLKFKDISVQSGVQSLTRWCSGVSVVDINSDGWMDVYLSVTMSSNPDKRRNILYINKGTNQEGIPTFEDKAFEYGIDDTGYSVFAAFFDYDLDSDLDLYVLTNQRLQNVPTNYRAKITDGSSPNNDRLYRNNGDNTFTNVSKEAGITIEGFGLGLAVSDFNEDGWPDLYVSNDYLSNDLMYINNQDGTFSNQISKLIAHQSEFSMGNDVADVNNDAKPDIITLDMLPETSFRKKTTIGNKSYQNYIYNEQYDYEYQYVRNMLQINNGADQGVKFSEVGQLSGIYQTEWSWSPLFADFDNDGFKDLLITNGFPKDITDKDFANFRANISSIAGNEYLIDSIPEIKIPNYAFRNNGDLTFTDVTKEWGVGIPSYSNGAAFADLDNDGDLDYVVNNINQPAFLFENTLYSEKPNPTNPNYIRLSLKPDLKSSVFGSKVFLYTKGSVQFVEASIYRGYLSSVESILHFGFGEVGVIDSILIKWPDGSVTKKINVSVNQTLIIDKTETVKNHPTVKNYSQQLFAKVDPIKSGLTFVHEEEDKIDYNLQRTIPHKFSQSGPGIGVGDINGDGKEDIYVGGSSGYPGTMFIQGKNGFKKQLFNKSTTNIEEDEGVLFFDSDNDSDLDLYLVSGSLEGKPDSENYMHRLYQNDGKGNFKLVPGNLPAITSSGSCVRAADFDADGDFDLFVAGRVIPGAYPLSPRSYILLNDQGKFTDATEKMSADLLKPGLITDALWTDFNNDGLTDLILVGEFTSIHFYQNNGKGFNKLTDAIESYTGWWNSIASADFDLDGDMDYVVGNLGLNNNYGASTKYPLSLYAKDFDGNGSIDPILACYSKLNFDSETMELCPIHFWDEINSQSPKFRQQFSYYKQYGAITMEGLLSKKDLEGAIILKANHFASSYIENLGNSKFRLNMLPTLAQVSSINGIVCDDFNEDGFPDILAVGNNYGHEVFAGRFDALTGLLLVGNGKGSFKNLPSALSGFLVDGDAKALVRVNVGDSDFYIATQNRDSLKVYQMTQGDKRFIFKPGFQDCWGEIVYRDKKQKIEFNYGSGYWSQSSRSVRIPSNAQYINVFDSRRNSRRIEIND